MKIRIFCLLLLLLLCGCTQPEEPYFSSEPFSVSTTVDDFKITCTLQKQLYRNRSEINSKQPFPLEVRIDYLGDELAIPVWGRIHFSTVIYDVPMDDNEIGVISVDLGQKHLFGRDTAYVEKHDAKYLYDQYGSFSAGNYTAIVDVEFSLDEAHTEEIKAHFEIPFVLETNY